MDKEYIIRLPWPDRRLNENVKVHWAPLARIKKDARSIAKILTKAQGVPKMEEAILAFSYYPPDRRRRDCQNVAGMLKSTIDGIADGMGVDDHKFRCRYPDKFEEPVKGGCILVTVKP